MILQFMELPLLLQVAISIQLAILVLLIVALVLLLVICRKYGSFYKCVKKANTWFEDMDENTKKQEAIDLKILGIADAINQRMKSHFSSARNKQKGKNDVKHVEEKANTKGEGRTRQAQPRQNQSSYPSGRAYHGSSDTGYTKPSQRPGRQTDRDPRSSRP